MKILKIITCLWGLSLAIPSIQAQDLNDVSYDRLDSLMLLSYAQGDYPQAMKYMQVGLEKAKQENGVVDSIYANYVSNVGFFQDKLGNYKQAETLYLEGIDIYKALYGEAHEAYVTGLNNLALLYYTMGKYEEAAPIFERMLFIHRYELKEKSPSYIAAISNFAALCLELADYKQAEQLYKEAIRVRLKKHGDNSTEYAYSISNLASLYVEIDKYEEAILMYQQAKTIIKKTLGEEHPVYGELLNNLAMTYMQIDKGGNAERMLLQAKGIKEKTLGNQHIDYARVLSNLAGVYEEQGKYDVAQKIYQETVQIYSANHDENHISLTVPFENIADIHVAKGEYEAAISLYSKVKDIRAAYYESYHPSYIHTVNNFGNIYLAKGALDTALAYCILGLALNADNFETLYPNCNLNAPKSIDPMVFLADYQSYERTEAYAKLKGLDYSSVYELGITLEFLLKVTKQIYLEAVTKQAPNTDQKLKEHYEITKVAMALSRHIRNGFSAKENKLHLLKKYYTFATYGIEAALALGEEQYYKDAFQFAEQNKSILLADAMNGNRARTLGDLPDSLILKELNLQEEKAYLKKERSELSNTANSTGLKKELIAQENLLNQEIEAFLKSIENKYPKYHALKYADNTVTVEAIQKELDDHTLLLEYLVFEEKTYLFVVGASSVEIFPIVISKKELEEQVRQLRGNLRDYQNLLDTPEKVFQEYVASAYWFYENLLEVALKGKNVQRLIFVADGALGKLPFESFLTSEVGDQGAYNKLPYLIQDYTISYNYSASLWKEHQNFKAKTSAFKQGHLLAFAASYPEKIDSSWLSYRSSTNFELRSLLKPLPNVQKEVEVLEKSFKGKFLIGGAANETMFKQYMDQYSLIHLAMHGVLNVKVPMLSSLAFSENLDSLEDNFLQAYEISKLNLNADLVVLSACETGYGKFEQGEGVLSLGRSFMYAGSPSLIVSLWAVNDYSTAFIMQEMYKNIANGMYKDEALRAAKLEYLAVTKGVTAHPAFWSPFIQIGNNKAIYVAQKGSFNWWWFWGGLPILISAIFFIKKRKKTI